MSTRGCDIMISYIVSLDNLLKSNNALHIRTKWIHYVVISKVKTPRCSIKHNTFISVLLECKECVICERQICVVFAHPQVHCINLQPRAHVQEVRHSPLVQYDVDGHPSPRRRLQQVLEDLYVRQQVHHYGNHLKATQGTRDP